MTYLGNILLKLTRKLLPTGRAFRVPDSGNFRKLIEGLNESEEDAIKDIYSIFDSIFPDNENFDIEDARGWERALGMISNPNTSLEDRKLAIIRKLNHPGTIKARQNYRYLEYQLRLAGFDVYVFENRFPDGNGGWETRSPEEVAISTISAPVQYGQIQYGQAQMGQRFIYKIANSINPREDLPFSIGDNFRSTFFISSSELGVNARIPASREVEFRELVLRLKPVQTVAYAFVSITEPSIQSLLLEDEEPILLEDIGNVLLEDSL